MSSVQHLPDSTEKIFGQAVNRFRISRQMSQRDLAEELTELGMSVDASAVSRIEKGSRSVRLSEAVIIASALRVDLDTLLAQTKSPADKLASLRRKVESSLTDAALPVAWSMLSMWEVVYHLEKHPELLVDAPELEDVESPQDYLKYLAELLPEWPVSRESVLVVDDEAEAQRYLAPMIAFVRAHIILRDEYEDVFGFEVREKKRGVDSEES